MKENHLQSDVEATDDMMVWLALDASITILDTQTFTFGVGALTLVAE